MGEMYKFHIIKCIIRYNIGRHAGDLLGMLGNENISFTKPICDTETPIYTPLHSSCREKFFFEWPEKDAFLTNQVSFDHAWLTGWLINPISSALCLTDGCRQVLDRGHPAPPPINLSAPPANWLKWPAQNS